MVRPSQGSAKVALAAVGLQFDAVGAALRVRGLSCLQHHGPVPEEDEETWERKEEGWVNPLEGPRATKNEPASLPGTAPLVHRHHPTNTP